jgi:hypothetical protein
LVQITDRLPVFHTIRQQRGISMRLSSIALPFLASVVALP